MTNDYFPDGNNITGTEEDDWIKGNARKSRIADCFMKAKEIIEQQMNEKWMAFDRNFYNIQVLLICFRENNNNNVDYWFV